MNPPTLSSPSAPPTRSARFAPALLCAAIATAAVSLALAEPPAEPVAAPTQSEMKQMFNEHTAQSKLPADVHDALAQFVGDFSTTSEVHLAKPPAEPMVTHANTSGKWIMGGLFVEVNAAALPDEELRGERLIIYGYDPVARKYTMWQIESGNLTATSATGDYDTASRTFTFEGERDVGPMGRATVQWTIAVQGDGSLKQGIGLKMPGAEKAAEMVSVTHTRKAAK